MVRRRLRPPVEQIGLRSTFSMDPILCPTLSESYRKRPDKRVHFIVSMELYTRPCGESLPKSISYGCLLFYGRAFFAPRICSSLVFPPVGSSLVKHSKTSAPISITIDSCDAVWVCIPCARHWNAAPSSRPHGCQPKSGACIVLQISVDS